MCLYIFLICTRPLSSTLFPYTTLFRSLSHQPWRSQGFYLVLLAALVIVLPLTFAGIPPMTLLFVSGIIGGLGTPLLLVLLMRSEEHTSELQSRFDLVCRLLLDKN